jgi:hypothetical protein
MLIVRPILRHRELTWKGLLMKSFFSRRELTCKKRNLNGLLFFLSGDYLQKIALMVRSIVRQRELRYKTLL